MGFFNNVRRDTPQQPQMVGSINPPEPDVAKALQPEPKPEPKDELLKQRKASLVEMHSKLVDQVCHHPNDFDILAQLKCSDSKGSKADLVTDIRLMQAELEAAPAPEPKPEPKPEASLAEVAGALNRAMAEQPMTQEPAAPATATKTLYLGCHPRSTSVGYFDQLLGDVIAKVEEAAGEPYLLIKYNEGPKRVAAMLAADIHGERLALPDHLVVDRRHPAADYCVDVLARCYDVIIERLG